MDSSKTRGQKRKYKTLLSSIDKMEPFKRLNNISVNNNEITYEHFHVPCGSWLANSKISGKIKTSFCKKWIEKTEYFIDKKPKQLPFCKVVAAITYPDVCESQIIIFYDEKYYDSFGDRKGPYQIWTPIEGKYSFAKGRGIITELSERGYIEDLNDEDFCVKSQIWFYGELTEK